MKNRYKFSLRLKLVVFTTILAIITYTSSAFFIYVLAEKLEGILHMSQQTYMVTVLVLGIIWSGILAFIAAGFITRPILKVKDAATHAAEGNVGDEVDIVKSDDEVRALGVAFNSMLANLREIIIKIDTNFDSTNKCVVEIKEAANKAATQANTISTTIDEISRGAESTSDAIQNTVESIEDSTRLASEVQQNAQKSQELSQDMLKTLDHSKQVVQALVSGIQQIATEQEHSLESVERLETNAKEVEKIISLVGDIAEQTNLLALNASIEAARAGEHGKGFAVVAEEVRKLADESAKAVQGISGLIANIQTDVQQVVHKIKEQVKFAQNESSKGQQTNEAIHEMTNSINQVASSVTQITGLMDTQLDTMKQTAVQSQEVAAIAQQTSAGTQQVNAFIQEQTASIENVQELANALEEQAQALNRQINKFNTSRTK